MVPKFGGLGQVCFGTVDRRALIVNVTVQMVDSGLKGPDPSLEKDVGDVMINISSVLVSCVGHQVLT